MAFEPTGKVDLRFSAPEATAPPWSDVDAVLTSAKMFSISTVRPDGRPHVVPLPAVWTNSALHICTGDQEQKAKNLARDQRCVLITSNARLDSGLDVVVEGVAGLVTDQDELQRLALLWKERLDTVYQVREAGFRNQWNDGIVVFAVKPVKVLAFAKGELGSQTRFTFAD